jgi:hypothetical protein
MRPSKLGICAEASPGNNMTRPEANTKAADIAIDDLAIEDLPIKVLPIPRIELSCAERSIGRIGRFSGAGPLLD